MEHLKEPLRYLYLPAELNHCTPERRYSILTHSTRLEREREAIRESVLAPTSILAGFAQGLIQIS